MRPLLWNAFCGVSIKVLMPLAYNKLLMLGCQVLGVFQFLRFESYRFPENDLPFHLEHRLPATLANVDMDRPMFIAVEEKPKAVLGEDSWHFQTAMGALIEGWGL